MKKTVVSIAVILVTAFCLAAAPHDKVLSFDASGFSIEPLEGGGEGTRLQTLAMGLPAANGFSPNVNVNLQPYAGTLDEFIALSNGQMKAAKFITIDEKRDAESYRWEYSGNAQGRLLHFFARVEIHGGVAYLVTATALDSHWSKYKDRLVQCVESFARK